MSKTQAMDSRTLYNLSSEYASHARKMRPFLSSDAHVKQYRILMYHAVNALKMIKAKHQLSIEQDVLVTLELFELLVQETHDLDLAEMYLSSVHERLYGTTLVHQKMLVTAALVRVARARRSVKHSKESLRLVTGTLVDLEPLNSRWNLYFQFLRIELLLEISPSDSKIPGLFDTLITDCDSVLNLQAFVICSYICIRLTQNQGICQAHLDKLGALKSQKLPIQLRLWSSLVELLVLIYRDLNITTKLSEFKDLVATHKKELKDSTFHLRLDDQISISVDTPIVRYKDFKNIILLFQSVSYLTNCYDKKANFSVKFLPKIQQAANELKNISEPVNLELSDSRKCFYMLIVDLCNYYMCLESLILTGSCADIESDSAYAILIKAMKAQLRRDTPTALENYSLLNTQKNAPEFKLIGLSSMFAVKVANMSKVGGTVSFPEYNEVTELWECIEKLFSSHSFHENHIWQCTIIILWLCSHFQPFTSAKLFKDNDDASHLERLKFYFSANSFARAGKSSSHNSATVDGKEAAPVLKKSLLLHFLLNYLACAIIVHDLEEKCVITNACFHLGKQQHMPLMEYISGLSHLLNCGLAMKGKDVSLTRSKLKEAVKKLVISGFEQVQE
ncbi:LAME_0C06128g1_1 [Lachancea meyersii CBS 8951]|uniref:LAME_0C06128g1_1 n=1 Tax=Lachancea meyersii CBS 8951 TaxID=1266667 RepID=A0A1G4J2D3_9SACH|nr:LAME_0C06128g1_1 [Lachancea meyersii CBS 8951]